MYMFALVILHTCALFYFAFPAVSVTIAEKPESLFPYDYVCISDDGDDKFFDHIKETYHADITSFPMVRVTRQDRKVGKYPRRKDTTGAADRNLGDDLPRIKKGKWSDSEIIPKCVRCKWK